MTAQSKQFNIFGPNYAGMRVSRVLLFDHKATEYLAIGLTSGNCIIKLADKVMNDEIIDQIFSANCIGDKLFKPYNSDKLLNSNSLARRTSSAAALNKSESRTGESRD